MSFATTIVLLLAAQHQPLLTMDLDNVQGGEKDQWGVYREGMEWTFGPVFGYLKSDGAKEGSAFGGVQWRSGVSDQFEVGASLTFHREIFEDNLTGDDVKISVVPLEMSLIYALMPGPQVRPYAMIGGGAYFVRSAYNDPLIKDNSDVVFGGHFGGGVEIAANPKFTFTADVRYVFIGEPDADIRDDRFNHWQIGIGGIFRF